MSEAKLCDICNKPITAKQSILFNSGLYEQYKVKIQYMREGFSMAGYFSKKECLDVCPTCMNKFVKFAKEEKNSGADMIDEECLKCQHHESGGCDTWCDHGEAFEISN